MPFLFITVFMTFAGMFISIELIQNYYQFKLNQQANNVSNELEKHFNQIIRYQYLKWNDNNTQSAPSFLDSVFSDTIHNKISFSYRNIAPYFFINISDSNTGQIQVPFDYYLLSNFNYTNGVSIYIRHQNQLHKIIDNHQFNQFPNIFPKRIDTKYLFDKSDNQFSIVEYKKEEYSQFVFSHSEFENIYLSVAIPSSMISHHKRIALLLIVCSLLLINSLIASIYIFILKRITRSLTQITDAAKKISKGQSTNPVKIQSNDEIGHLAQSFNDMLNNVQTKTSELIYERNRSKMILAQLPDGIIVTDAHHKLILANRAAETMLGFSTDRAKGQTIIQYIKNEKLHTVFSDHLKDISTSNITRELMIPSSDNKEEYYQIILSPLLDTTYQHTGIITVIRNITEERHIKTMRDHFLQTVTHELRTPLTSIIGFLDIVVKENYGPLNAKQSEFLNITMHNSHYLKKLINNLYELSNIQSGKATLVLSHFPIHNILERVAGSQSIMLNKRNNQLKFDIQNNQIHIYADQQRIYEIIENLVINANKSTENGIIEIIVTQTPTFITLIVKDSGIGLSEDQRHLFIDALSSHSTNNYKIFETLGLDLVIVKELVTLHNGELFLESDQKSGTIFTINLPQSDTISSVETNTPHEQPITNQEQFTQNYF